MLIMGAPGAGKGTQARQISDHYGIPAISTGAIFRRHIAEQTELGKRVKEIISAGDFVPDVLTTALVAQRLLEPDARRGFLLDGYPRTAAQVAALDIMLGDLGTALDCVLTLEADVDDLVARLLKRAEIEGRSDDNETTIRHRMSVYEAETAELMDIFARRGILLSVNGEGGIDEVTQRIVAAIDEFIGAR